MTAEMKIPLTWEMYAIERTDALGNVTYLHCGSKRFVELHGFKEPVVPIVLTEDENGSYWGWLETNEKEVSMIWPSKTLLIMCFTYGLDAAVERNEGRVVRMRAEKCELCKMCGKHAPDWDSKHLDRGRRETANAIQYHCREAQVED